MSRGCVCSGKRRGKKGGLTAYTLRGKAAVYCWGVMFGDEALSQR